MKADELAACLEASAGRHQGRQADALPGGAVAAAAGSTSLPAVGEAGCHCGGDSGEKAVSSSAAVGGEEVLQEYAEVSLCSPLPPTEVLARAVSLVPEICGADAESPEDRGAALAQALQRSFAARGVQVKGVLGPQQPIARAVSCPVFGKRQDPLFQRSGRLQAWAEEESCSTTPSPSPGRGAVGSSDAEEEASGAVVGWEEKTPSSSGGCFEDAATPRLQSPMSAFFNPCPGAAAVWGAADVRDPWRAAPSQPEGQAGQADSQRQLLQQPPQHQQPQAAMAEAAEVVEPLPDEGPASQWLQTEGAANVFWHVPERYRLGQLLGSGAYGSVCEAWDTQGQRKVAVKRIDGVYQDSVICKRILREVAILSHLRHHNIVQIFDLPMPSSLDNYEVLYIVMERCDTDLRKVCYNSKGVTLPQARKLAYGLLVGCSYLHSAGIYHRDLKPANCLVNREDCTVRICDFNLAVSVDQRPLSPPTSSGGGGPSRAPLRRSLTAHVATRWYRPPEVLLVLGYSEAMDVWSAGCIVAELFLALNVGGRRPRRGALFPGNRDPLLSAVSTESDEEVCHAGDQLSVIFDVLGTPTEEEIESIESESGRWHLRSYPARPGRGLRVRLPADSVGEEGFDLLERMLRLLPGGRISMAEAVHHPFFDATRVARAEEEGLAEGRVDIGFDEEELERSYSTIPYKLKHEIEVFQPPLPPTQTIGPAVQTARPQGIQRW